MKARTATKFAAVTDLVAAPQKEFLSLGILQIDYTNTLWPQRIEREQAILQANRARLRPILKATLMLLFAMLPIALGQGPGATSRASMAKGIIDGQPPRLLITPLFFAPRRSRRSKIPASRDRAAARFIRTQLAQLRTHFFQ